MSLVSVPCLRMAALHTQPDRTRQAAYPCYDRSLQLRCQRCMSFYRKRLQQTSRYPNARTCSQPGQVLPLSWKRTPVIQQAKHQQCLSSSATVHLLAIGCNLIKTVYIHRNSSRAMRRRVAMLSNICCTVRTQVLRFKLKRCWAVHVSDHGF